MNSKTPLVYIVLPVYNGEKYFLEQLMSLYYQNYTNWYLIVINDGSTDNSEKIVRDWVSHYNLYDKVKIINKENGGVTSAVQKGLEEVNKMYKENNSESFVAFCDADDIRTREKLEMQVKYMLDHPEYGLSYHDLASVNENGYFQKFSQLKGYWHNESFLYISTVGGYFSSITMMFKSEYVDKILPMPLGKEFAQDYWTVLVLALLDVGIGFIGKSLCYRRLRTQSLSKIHNQDFLLNRQKYYKYLQERFPEKDLSYIIKCNQDWMVNWRKNGRNLPYILFRLMLRYPKVFWLCVRMGLHKILKI